MESTAENRYAGFMFVYDGVEYRGTDERELNSLVWDVVHDNFLLWNARFREWLADNYNVVSLFEELNTGDGSGFEKVASEFAEHEMCLNRDQVIEESIRMDLVETEVVE